IAGRLTPRAALFSSRARNPIACVSFPRRDSASFTAGRIIPNVWSSAASEVDMEEDETRRGQLIRQWMAIGARNGLLLGAVACAMVWTPVLTSGLPTRHRLFEMIQDS